MSVQETSGRARIERPTGDLDPMASLAADVREGLSASPKWLRPKYFYDAVGSKLFERITELPEYYQTRTERGILERVTDEVVEEMAPRSLVEFGSGSASKTRIIMDAMQRRHLLEGFGAIEVSEAALLASARELQARYPGLLFRGVLADFESPVALPFADRARLLLFLGSTIGNLTEDEAISFLGGVRARMRAPDGFWIGFDLVKDPARLTAAYNDAQGVTAAFNLNILRVLNRELDGDFRLEDFEHRAVYEPAESRIEMSLVARRPVRVRLAAIDLEVRFEEGEAVGTELSQKYTRASAGRLLSRAKLDLARWDTDPEERFALALARPPEAAQRADPAWSSEPA